MKKNNTFSYTYANYEQNLAISQGVHIATVDYAKTSHNPIVTSICGGDTSGTSCPSALANSFAFSSGSSLFLSGYSPHSSAYIPISSSGLYYQFASACRSKGGKYLATGLMAASLLQGIMAPYALAFTSDVNNGETQTGLVLSAGDTQNVNNGGTASGTTINSDGLQRIYNGGIANDTTINSLGRQLVYDGGTANDTTINEVGRQHVYDGGIANDATINSGGSQDVLNGGTANDTIINDGRQNVSNGGIANDATINSGGRQYISNGGIANSTTLNNGVQAVSNGGIAKDTTIVGNAFQDVYGTVSGTTINAGGLQRIYNGGIISGTTVNSGGYQEFNGVTATYNVSANTLNSGASQAFISGAVATGLVGGTVENGIIQFITYGGSAVDVTVSSGGLQQVDGGTVSGITVNAGGLQQIEDGGTISGVTVNSGGVQVFDGAMATLNVTNNTLNSGASQTFQSGAVATGSVGGSVENGITQIINFGGSAVDVTVSSGGLQQVDGGTASGTILHAGGTQAIFTGGTITGDMSYGAEQVLRAQGGNFTDNVAFNGGIFVPVLVPALPNNPVNVAGEVTGMAGGTIAPVWFNDQAGSGEETYTVLSASVALTETFGTETELVKATYTQEISGNELLLKVVEKNDVYQGYSNYLSPNGQNLAVILDTIDASGQLPKLMTALGNLPANGEAVAEAIRQLLPESFATANALNQSIIRAFMAQIPSMAEGTLNKQASNANQDNTSNGVASLESGLPAGSALKQNTWQFFGSPFGFTATQQSTDDFSGYDMTVGGVNLGIMRSFDNYWLGASLGYSSQYLKMKDMDAKIDSDQLMLSVFGGVRHENFFAEAALGYAHTWNDSSRNVNIGTGVTAYYDELTANYGQDSFLASLTLGYVFEFENNFRIIPSIGVDYVYTHSNAFEESGGDGAFGIDAGSFYSLQIPVSITLEKSFMVNEAIITPSLTVSWIPELGDSYATTNAHFVNAPSAGSFETRSIENDRHTFAVGAGLDMQFSEDFGINVNYELNTRSQYTSHSVDVNFKWEF